MKAAIREANLFFDWIGENTNEIHIPKKDKERTSSAILQQSLDIGEGILLLLKNRLPGPAFALARSHFETYVCGVWLLDVASEDEISQYHNGRVPKIETLVKKVYDFDRELHHWVKRNKEKNLTDFHGLAHSGPEHFYRRLSEEGNIEPSYREDEIVRLIQHSNTIQCGIALYLFLIADDSSAAQAIRKEVDKLRITSPFKNIAEH